jgi:hypothetical protein
LGSYSALVVAVSDIWGVLGVKRASMF